MQVTTDLYINDRKITLPLTETFTHTFDETLFCITFPRPLHKPENKKPSESTHYVVFLPLYSHGRVHAAGGHTLQADVAVFQGHLWLGLLHNDGQGKVTCADNQYCTSTQT